MPGRAARTACSSVPGVAAGAAGGDLHQRRVIGKDGKRDRLAAARRRFIVSVRPAAASSRSQYVEGHPPDDAPTRSRIDQATADDEDFKRRRHDPVAGRGARASSYTLVGLRSSPAATRFGGATRRAAHAARGPALTGKVGRFDEIDVAAEPGVTPDAAQRDRSAQVVPRDVTSAPASEQADQQSKDIQRRARLPAHGAARVRRRSRCSSARSSSSTRSRSPSPSARASSRCCGRSAPRARQVLRSVLVEGLRARRARRRSSGLGSGIALAPGLRALFKALGVDLPSSGTVSSRARSSSRCSSGIVVTLLVEPRAGAARHARAAGRRAARGRGAAAGRAARWPSRRSAARAHRSAARRSWPGGLFGGGSSQSLSLARRRRGADVPRRRAAQPAARAAARLGRRPAARALRGHHRPPGARERRAPARAAPPSPRRR